jgi:hypothetical protein
MGRVVESAIAASLAAAALGSDQQGVRSKEHFGLLKSSERFGKLTKARFVFPLLAIQKHSRTFADSLSKKSLLIGREHESNSEYGSGQ